MLLWANMYGIIVSFFSLLIVLVLGGIFGGTRFYSFVIYFAVVNASADLCFRKWLTKEEIEKADKPVSESGRKDLDNFWLLSTLGPSFCSMPLWIASVLIMLAWGMYQFYA